jgi:chemotaxis protein CheD
VPELVDIFCVSARLPQHFLPPGGLLVVSRPCNVTTILGPCVAVTLWCRRSHVAAICHAVLPTASAGARSSADFHLGKYVRDAIPEMFARFRREGGDLASVEAKLFGGAHLFDGPSAVPAGRIGAQNVRLAREILEEHRLAVIAFDVGGQTGRKLIFDTLTGDVRVKHLPSSSLIPA